MASKACDSRRPEQAIGRIAQRVTDPIGRWAWLAADYRMNCPRGLVGLSQRGERLMLLLLLHRWRSLQRRRASNATPPPPPLSPLQRYWRRQPMHSMRQVLSATCRRCRVTDGSLN
jgi:hypothetical protein